MDLVPENPRPFISTTETFHRPSRYFGLTNSVNQSGKIADTIDSATGTSE